MFPAMPDPRRALSSCRPPLRVWYPKSQCAACDVMPRLLVARHGPLLRRSARFI